MAELLSSTRRAVQGLALATILTLGMASQAAASPPYAAQAPSVSGTAEVGQTLNAATGTWNGTPSPTLSYQWQRCEAVSPSSSEFVSLAGSFPETLVLDPTGNVFTANRDTDNISKITPAGNPVNATGTTVGAPFTWALAGDGPLGSAIGADGNVYVANRSSGTVTKASVQGTATALTSAGNPGNVAVDSRGYVYAANTTAGTISKFAPGGTTAVTTFTGFGAAFFGMAFDSSDNLYVADSSNNQVVKISADATGPAGVSVFGSTGAGSFPFSIVVDEAGNVYTVNGSSNTVSKLLPNGTAAGAPWPVATEATSSVDEGLAIDLDGNLYATNGTNSTSPGSVTKITPAGVASTLGSTGAWPLGIDTDAAGNVYVANRLGDSVTKITQTSCSDISGATSASYALQPADYQKRIRVQVSGVNGVTPSSSASSKMTAQVAGAAPANTAAPAISGTPQEGQALTATDGTWTGYPTPSFSIKWQSSSDGSTGWTDISGATSSTYAVPSSMVGMYLRVQVTASNALGSASASSVPTARLGGPTPAPSPSVAPVGASPPSPNTPPQPKVTLCHSGNGKNFTTITIAPEAAIEGHARNHDDDIIPPFDYVKNGRTLQYAGQNWDARGRAILNAGCQTPSTSPANQVLDPPARSRVTICHSGNGKNFTEITVAPQAAYNGHARNHSDDIIPPFSSGNISFPGQNWDASGRAIWSNGCSPPQPVTDPLEDPARKVSLCHSAGGNKYVTIEVAAAGALNGHSAQHAEDIIPPFTYRERGQEKTFPGQNWNDAGKAIFNNGCVEPLPPPSEREPDPVVPEVTCIDRASDGTYTARFGYRSSGVLPQTVPVGSNNYVSSGVTGAGGAGGAGDGSSGPTVSGPPSVFQPGTVASAVTVSGIPGGYTMSWTITVGGKTTTATASAGSPQCQPEPEAVDFGLFAVCTDRNSDGSYSVTFGYQNDNVLPVSAPVGNGNKVLVNGAGGPDRGQPASLGSGRNANAFKISGLRANESVSWQVIVGGLERVATASVATPACATPPEPEPEPQPKPQPLEPVGPSVRCVARNSDGTYNVVFGYSNPNSVTVVVEGGAANALSVSPGGPGPETRGQPTAFEPGAVGNAFTVTNVPAGQEITWTVASYGTRSATAGIGYPERCEGDTPEKTPEPPPIEPEPEKQAIGIYLKCVDAGKTSFSATFGYYNPGSIAVTIPTGAANRFSGSAVNAELPSVFSPGDAPEAFRVTGIPIRERPAWKLVSPDGTIAVVRADPAAPNCTTGNPERGPETNVDPEVPRRIPDKKPTEIDITNPGTEIDWKPRIQVDPPSWVDVNSVKAVGFVCRRSRGVIVCTSARLLPGQRAVISYRARCSRKGRGVIAVASVVRRVNNRPGQVASGSGQVRSAGCGPRYTG